MDRTNVGSHEIRLLTEAGRLAEALELVDRKLRTWPGNDFLRAVRENLVVSLAREGAARAS